MKTYLSDKIQFIKMSDKNKRIIENNLSDKKKSIKMSDKNTTNTLKK